MEQITIDGAIASIITDRVIPPGDRGVSQSSIKLVLYVLRGLGAPGSTIKVDRQVILDRTCLGHTAVKKAIRVLVDDSILFQTQRPSEGRPAQYTMSYVALMSWLDDHDQAVVQAYAEPKQRGRVAAASKSTGAHGVGTRAHGVGTRAHGVPAIKEETALPAIPAAAEQQVDIHNLDRRLSNAAAAAVGIMKLETWERIGKQAGLDREMSTLAARTMEQLEVKSCETGRRALDRLSERLRSPRTIANPIGLLRAIITQEGGPEDSVDSLRRSRVQDGKRKKVQADLESCDSDRLELIGKATTIVARGLGHIGTQETIELSNDPGTLDYLAKYNREIMIQAATMIPSGATS